MARIQLVAVLVFYFLISPAFGGTKECPSLLEALGDDVVVADLSGMFDSYPLESLLSSDPEKNLAALHPHIVMDSSQVLWHLIEREESKRIIEPNFKSRKINIWPMLSRGIELKRTGKPRLIIDQYEAIDELVSYIRSRARGDRKGKFLLFKGPTGTGKTEFLVILSELAQELALSDPDYYEFTFEWVGLENVPYLKTYARVVGNGRPIRNPMQRSPLTLLPPEIQEKVVELANPRVQELIGYKAQPVLQRDPQTSEIIDAILQHELSAEEAATLSPSRYVEVLGKYVQIVRKKKDPNAPPSVVRFQGRHPQWSKIFFEESIPLMQVYTSGSALSYMYTGTFPRADGGGLFLDEFFRNPQGLLDTALELMENGVLDFGGAPPMALDVVPIASSNDESIEDSLDNGPSKAILDRARVFPMRQPINPHSVAKTAILMMGVGKFKMKDLSKKSSKLEPLDINKVFTVPDENGELLWPEDRYAIYYSANKDQDVLISPHSLTLLGLTVAATRIVTDPKEIADFGEELDLRNVNEYGQYFYDSKGRMQVVMGQTDPGPTVRRTLDNLTKLLQEGQSGIMARKAEEWLRRSIELSKYNENTVTPALVDRAFDQLMKEGGLEPGNGETRSRWFEEHNKMKEAFLLQLLTRDVQAVLSGDRGRVDRLYNEIVAEIVALANDDKSKKVLEPGGGERPINFGRLQKIAKHYREKNGKDLAYGEIRNFRAQVVDPSQEYVPLKRAIEAFLLESELDTQAMGEIHDYFDGKSVGRDARERARQAEKLLDGSGYNTQSFKEALKLITQLRTRIEMRRNGI